MKFQLSLIAALCLIAPCGCVESQTHKDSAPFETQELDGCLAICIDMSGSFAESWDDRAYNLFLSLIDQYFTEAMGTENRVIVSQLSGSGDAVLFEGTPSDLQRKFPSPESLNVYLKEKSDASASNVYDSVRQTVEYVGTINGVSDRTRILTVVLSDLRESEWDQTRRSKQGIAMVYALQTYADRGGALALYFVAADEIPRWTKIMDEAGFEAGQYIIENELNATPQLPKFD